MADPAVREAISRQARAWLEGNALVRDTETTGLGDDAELHRSRRNANQERTALARGSYRCIDPAPVEGRQADLDVSSREKHEVRLRNVLDVARCGLRSHVPSIGDVDTIHRGLEDLIELSTIAV